MKNKRFLRIFTLSLILTLGACATQTSPNRGGDFDPVEAAKTRISLGLTYLKNGNYTQAKINLDKALEFAPRLADSHFSLAYYYQLVAENERAQEAYQRALELDPRNADIANSYGAFLCQQGQYEKAKGFFLKAVNSKTYAAAAETYENLALCSQSQGQLQDAIGYLKTALQHQPTRAKSLLLLTELLSADGQWQEAKLNLKKYEKVASVSADTLWMAARIENGLGNSDIAEGYGQMLVKMYPNHPNTRAYLSRLRRGNTHQETSLPLVLPKKDAGKQAETSSESDTANQVPAYHIVQKSENLYRISLQYNIKMSRLIEWNQLEDASAIYVGMKLLLSDPTQN